jgi:hypothetical protein
MRQRATLGGNDVRAAFQQFRRETGGKHCRQRPEPRRHGQFRRRIAAHQYFERAHRLVAHELQLAGRVAIGLQ